jgi:hypothetical protein
MVLARSFCRWFWYTFITYGFSNELCHEKFTYASLHYSRCMHENVRSFFLVVVQESEVEINTIEMVLYW